MIESIQLDVLITQLNLDWKIVLFSVEFIKFCPLLFYFCFHKTSYPILFQYYTCIVMRLYGTSRRSY